MSLRWRIALAVAGLGAVVATVAAVGAYFMTAAQLYGALDESLSTRAREVGIGPDESGDSVRGSVDEVGCPPDAVLRPAAGAQIVRPDGSIAVCLPGGPLLPVPEEPPTGDQVLLGTVEVEGASFRVAAHVFHEGGVLQVAGAEADVTDVLGALKWRLVLLALAVGVGTGVVGWLVAGRLVRPLVHLRDTAQRIAVSQDLTTPVLVEGSGEIRDLAVSLTTMVDALASSRAEQQRLITDASHEMRTPLTSLTTNLELLRRFEELPADERPDVLATVHSEVDELTHLMEELVELVTDRSSDEPVVALDLADLAASVVARTRRRSGRAVELVLDGDGTVLARPHMIERAIANLVDNAVKYSPASTPIEVRVGPARVEVRDQGPGIAASEQDRVFERFYRADSARSVPGSGLGLAIVCQIVERHNGSVWARTGPTGGAWVGFSLDGE